jgi:hypothetical protein
VVPGFARAFRLAQLPLGPATRATLARMHLRTLGDLHELPLSRFYGEAEQGGDKIADLAVTIARVREGKVVPAKQARSAAPRGLIAALDQALEALDADRREILLVRFGADGQEPQNETETAKRLGLGTRQNVQQRQRTALKHLLLAAGPELSRALRGLERKAESGEEPIDAALVRELGTAPKRRHAPAFYRRILEKVAFGPR